MNILANKSNVHSSPSVAIVEVRLRANLFSAKLSDGRLVSLPLSLDGLQWLARATPQQRRKWVIDPSGLYVIWEELGDGISIEHLLRTQALE